MFPILARAALVLVGSFAFAVLSTAFVQCWAAAGRARRKVNPRP